MRIFKSVYKLRAKLSGNLFAEHVFTNFSVNLQIFLLPNIDFCVFRVCFFNDSDGELVKSSFILVVISSS